MKTVLVTADAVRADHLGQYGYGRDTMPAVDRLADGGTLFEAAFANGTHSGVSIPSFLTSRHRGGEAVQSGPSLATALSDAGVRTAAFHSNTMLANEFDPFAGFDTFEDFGVGEDGSEHEPFEESLPAALVGKAAAATNLLAERSPRLRDLRDRLVPPEHRFHFQVYVDAATLTDRVLSWLSAHGDEAFFLWVHYMDPHRPYGLDPDEPAFADDAVADGTIRSLMSRAGTNPGEVTDDERRLLLDLYDSDLRYTSEQLDRLLDGIDRHCGREETLVAFTADHGEEFGEHNRYFHVNRPYDELLHVPLVVGHPGREPGRVAEQRPLLDLAPTICAFHGVDPPADFRGQSLFDPGERTVLATGSLVDDGAVASVRTGDWKYIAADGDEELYHLDEDPGERRNVVADAPERAADLRAEIPDRLLRADSGPTPSDATGDARERLERLGYLE